MGQGGRTIPLSRPQAWLLALQGLEHGFGHRPEYAAAAAAVTGLDTFLWIYEEAQGKAACVVSMRPGDPGPDLVTPLGFAGFVLQGQPDGLAAAWARYWDREGVIAGFVQLSPFQSPENWRSRLPGFGPWLGPARECWCWDLRPEPDELLCAMSPKHRQLLHKWQRESSGLCWDVDAVLPQFCELYAAFLQQNPLSPIYNYGERELAALATAPGAMLVGAAGTDGRIEAAMLFLSANGFAESFLSASTVAGRWHSRALYWGGALKLRESGVRHLNLGGGIAPGDGLSDFKQRLGAQRAPTLALRQVFDQARYQAACEHAGVDMAASSYFPAWRAPR